MRSLLCGRPQVDLHSNDLTDADSVIAMAEGCPQLQFLDLRDNDFSGSQIERIRAAFGGSRKVPITLLTDKKGGCVVQ